MEQDGASLNQRHMQGETTTEKISLIADPEDGGTAKRRAKLRQHSETWKNIVQMIPVLKAYEILILKILFWKILRQPVDVLVAVHQTRVT